MVARRSMASPTGSGWNAAASAMMAVPPRSKAPGMTALELVGGVIADEHEDGRLRDHQILPLFEGDLHRRLAKEDGVVTLPRLHREVAHVPTGRLPGLVLVAGDVADGQPRTGREHPTALHLLRLNRRGRQVQAHARAVLPLLRRDQHSIPDDDQFLPRVCHAPDPPPVAYQVTPAPAGTQGSETGRMAPFRGVSYPSRGIGIGMRAVGVLLAAVRLRVLLTGLLVHRVRLVGFDAAIGPGLLRIAAVSPTLVRARRTPPRSASDHRGGRPGPHRDARVRPQGPGLPVRDLSQ